MIEIGVTMRGCLLVGAFMAVDKVYYNTSPEWEGYNEYNKIRADLMDYGFPPYQQHADKYEKLGFSRNDIAVIKRWMLADYEKATYEDLKAVSDWKEPQKITGEVIKSYLSDFLKRIYTNKIFWLWLILILISINLNRLCKLYAGANIVIVAARDLSIYKEFRESRICYMISAVFSLSLGILSYKMSKMLIKE